MKTLLTRSLPALLLLVNAVAVLAVDFHGSQVDASRVTERIICDPTGHQMQHDSKNCEGRCGEDSRCYPQGNGESKAK